MSIHREFQEKHAALATAYRKLMNKHFTSAADEHREGASDTSVKRHDDEFRAAEDDFITALLAELSRNEEDAKRIEWLARNHWLERKSYSDSSVATGDVAWPMDEVTILAHREDGTIHPVDGKSFRECVDNCMNVAAAAPEQKSQEDAP